MIYLIAIAFILLFRLLSRHSRVPQDHYCRFCRSTGPEACPMCRPTRF